jgi:uncharacterized protein YllA (UPF0747 family)
MTRQEYDFRMQEIIARGVTDMHKSLLQTQAGLIYIASLEAEIKRLREDNEQLIEQINKQGDTNERQD